MFYFYKSVLPGAQTNGAVEVFIKPGSHTHVLDSVLQITDEPVHSSLQSHDESRGFSERNKQRWYSMQYHYLYAYKKYS